MTKSKKRRGRPRIDGPREANGRLVRKATRADREKVIMAVVESRCRAVGIWPEPVAQVPGEPDEAFEARRAARLAMIRAAMPFVGLPWMGSNVGRRLAACLDIADLWAVVTMIQTRHRAHQRAIDAPRQIATMALMMARKPAGAAGDAVESVGADPRTEEERNAGAIAAWESVQTWAEEVEAEAERRARVSLLDVVLSDDPPETYPLASRLRAMKAKVDGEHPDPVARGEGHSLAEAAARAWVFECSLTYPGGKTERQVRVIEDAGALRDEAVKALAGVMRKKER